MWLLLPPSCHYCRFLFLSLSHSHSPALFLLSEFFLSFLHLSPLFRWVPLPSSIHHFFEIFFHNSLPSTSFSSLLLLHSHSNQNCCRVQQIEARIEVRIPWIQHVRVKKNGEMWSGIRRPRSNWKKLQTLKFWEPINLKVWNFQNLAFYFILFILFHCHSWSCLHWIACVFECVVFDESENVEECWMCESLV